MSKTIVIGVLVATLCFVAIPATAAPLQKSVIGPGADWVVHADLEAFRNSTIGKLVLGELKARGIEDKMQEFAMVFSFNPLTDVRNVTLYGKGRDPSRIVVIGDGQFDAERLVSLVRMNPQFQETPYQGVTLYQWHNEDKKGGPGQLMYGFVREGRGVVISTGLDALKQAADNLRGAGPGPSASLASQVPSGDSGTFLQVAATGIGNLAGDDPKAAILKQAEMLTARAGEAKERLSVELSLRAQSPDMADKVMKVVVGLLALPELAAPEQPKLSELAKSVNVTRDDKVVQARFETSSQSIFAFLKEQWQKKQQQPQTPQGTQP